MEKLLKIQNELKAPKGQVNEFGNYRYRSCEDILEAVKPLLAKEGLVLTLTDKLIEMGEGTTLFADASKNIHELTHSLVYVKATARLTDGEKFIEVSAYAREEIQKKGQDASQTTGSASSYARKYALNGLFLIDDTRDEDNQNQEIAYITDSQRSQLLDMIADTESDMDKFLKYLKVDAIEKLPQAKFKMAMTALEKKKGA